MQMKCEKEVSEAKKKMSFFIYLARETLSFRAGRDSASATADPLLTTSYPIGYLSLLNIHRLYIKM